MNFLSTVMSANQTAYFCSQIPNVNIKSHAAKGIKVLVPWLLSEQVEHNCYRDFCLKDIGDPGNCQTAGEWAEIGISFVDLAICVVGIGTIVGVAAGLVYIARNSKRRNYVVLEDKTRSVFEL